MQKSALDYDKKLAIRRIQVNKGYKANVIDNVPTKFKFNVMRSYFENNVSADFAKSIALECLREVKSKQKNMKEVPVFADTLRNYITYLHEYNMTVFQISRLYPHSDEFSQLLIQYVVLECRILYTRQYFSKEREIQVQNRILRLLLNIYNGYFKCKMIPLKESIEKSVKAIVDIFFKLKLNFPDADYRILENMTAVLLKKIGRYEKISALKNKDISTVRDPDLTIFSTNVITSDYGTDESSNETLIQSPVCLDVEVNATNTQLEKYPIIEIKEEVEDHIESTSVKPNSKKFTWTICLDEDGKDEDLLFYTEEVESIRETKNNSSTRSTFGNEITSFQDRPKQLCIEPNRFGGINSIQDSKKQRSIEPNRFGGINSIQDSPKQRSIEANRFGGINSFQDSPKQRSIEANRFGRINSIQYSPKQRSIEANRFGGINSIQDSPIQLYSKPNKSDISFKSNNEVLVNNKKLISSKYVNWLKQTDEILDLNKDTDDEDEKPDIATLTSEEMDVDEYKRQTNNLYLNRIENEECDKKPIIKTIQLRELPEIIDTIVLDDDEDTQDDPNVNNNGANQVEADTTDVYSSCLSSSIKSSSEYEKSDNGISTTTEIQNSTEQPSLENYCLGSEKTTDNPENYIESHKEIEDNLDKTEDNLEEIVSEIEVVEESIVFQNENNLEEIKDSLEKTEDNLEEIEVVEESIVLQNENNLEEIKDNLEKTEDNLEEIVSEMEVVEESIVLQNENNLEGIKDTLEKTEDSLEEIVSEIEVVEESIVLQNENNLEEIKDSLEKTEDNLEEIVSEIEVVEESIILQNENIGSISKAPSNSVKITLLNPKDLENEKDIAGKKDMKLDIIKISEKLCDQVSTENKLCETVNSQIQTSNIDEQPLDCEEDLISDHDDRLPEENVSQLINEEPKKSTPLQKTIKVHYNIPIVRNNETSTIISYKTNTDNVLKVLPINTQNITVTKDSILDTKTSKTSTSVNIIDLDDTKQETMIDTINLDDDDDADTTEVKSNGEFVTELDNSQLEKITSKLDNLHVQDSINLVEAKTHSHNEVITELGDSQSDKFTLEVNKQDVLNEIDMEDDKVQNNTTTSKVDHNTKEECDLISTKNQNSLLVESQFKSNILFTSSNQEEPATNQDKTATTFVDQESHSQINVSALTYNSKENEYLNLQVKISPHCADLIPNKNETILLAEPQIIPDIQEEITLNYHADEEHQSQFTNFQVDKSEGQLKRNNIFFEESIYVQEVFSDYQLPLDYSTKSKVQEEETKLLTTTIENKIEKTASNFFHMDLTKAKKKVLTKSESTEDVNKIEALESQIKIGSVTQKYKTITKAKQEQSQIIPLLNKVHSEHLTKSLEEYNTFQNYNSSKETEFKFPISHTDIVSDWSHKYEVIKETPVFQSNQPSSMLMLAMAAEFKRKSEETRSKIVSKSPKKKTKLSKVKLKPSVSSRSSRLINNRKNLKKTEETENRRITRSRSSACDTILKPQGFKTTLPMKNVKIHQLPEFPTLKESTDGDSNDSESNMLIIDDKNTTDLSIYDENTLDENLKFRYKPKVECKIRNGKNSVGNKRPQKTKAERKLYEGPSVSLERLNKKSMDKPDIKIIKNTDENDNSQSVINLKIDKNASVDKYEAPFRHLSKKVHCKYQNIGKHILDGNNLQPVKNETNFLKPDNNVMPLNSSSFNISKSEENVLPTQLKKGPNLPAKLRNKLIKSTSTEIVTTDLSKCKNTVTSTSEKLKNRLKNEIKTVQTNTVLITGELRNGIDLPASVNNIIENCDPEDNPLNLRLTKDLKSPTRECINHRSISMNANNIDKSNLHPDAVISISTTTTKSTDMSESQKEVRAIKCSFSFEEEEIDQLIYKYTKCDKTKSKSLENFNEYQKDTITSTENLTSIIPVMKSSRHLKNSRSKSCAAKQPKEKKLRSRSLSTNKSEEFSETVSNSKRRTVQKTKLATPVEKKLRSRSSISEVDTNVSCIGTTHKINDYLTKNNHEETLTNKIKTQSVREPRDYSIRKKLRSRTPPNTEIKEVVSDHKLKSKPSISQEIDSKLLSIEIENISIDHIQKSKFKKPKKRRNNKNLLTKFEYNKNETLPEESPISFSTKAENVINDNTITDQSTLESTTVLISNIISSNVESSNEIENVKFKTNVISETILLKLPEEIVTSEEVQISKTTDCLSLKSDKFDNSSAADELKNNECSTQSKIKKTLDIQSNVEIISTTNHEEQKSTINKNIALVQDEAIKQNLEIKGNHISILSEEIKECVPIEEEILETNVDVIQEITTTSDFNASSSNEENKMYVKSKECRESVNELIQSSNQDMLVEQESCVPLAENKNLEPHFIDLPIRNDSIELPINIELINNSNNLQVPKLPNIMSKVVPVRKNSKITTAELCKRLRNQGKKGKRIINKIKGSKENYTSIESNKELINDSSELRRVKELVITEKNALYPAENIAEDEIFTHKNLVTNETIKSVGHKSLKVTLTSIIEEVKTTQESTVSNEIKATVENEKQKFSTINKDSKQKSSGVNEIQEIVEVQIPEISSNNNEVSIQSLELNKSEEHFLSEEINEIVEVVKNEEHMHLVKNESEHNELSTQISTKSSQMIEIDECELEKTSLLAQVNETEKIVDNEQQQISTQNEEVKHTEFTQMCSNDIKEQNKDKEAMPTEIKEIVGFKKQIEINEQPFSLPEVNEIVEKEEQISLPIHISRNIVENEFLLLKNTESNKIEVIVESEEQQISLSPLSTEDEELELIENKDPEYNEGKVIEDNQNNSLPMHINENHQLFTHISSEPTEIAELEHNELLLLKNTESNEIEVIVESEEQQISPLPLSKEIENVELIENKAADHNESKIIEDNQNNSLSMHINENNQVFTKISSKPTEIAELEHNEFVLLKNSESNEIEVIVESEEQQISPLPLEKVELIENKDPEHNESKIIEDNQNNSLSMHINENNQLFTQISSKPTEIAELEHDELLLLKNTESNEIEVIVESEEQQISPSPLSTENEEIELIKNKDPEHNESKIIEDNQNNSLPMHINENNQVFTQISSEPTEKAELEHNEFLLLKNTESNEKEVIVESEEQQISPLPLSTEIEKVELVENKYPEHNESKIIEDIQNNSLPMHINENNQLFTQINSEPTEIAELEHNQLLLLKNTESNEIEVIVESEEQQISPLPLSTENEAELIENNDPEHQLSSEEDKIIENNPLSRNLSGNEVERNQLLAQISSELTDKQQQQQSSDGNQIKNVETIDSQISSSTENEKLEDEESLSALPTENEEQKTDELLTEFDSIINTSLHKKNNSKSADEFKDDTEINKAPPTILEKSVIQADVPVTTDKNKINDVCINKVSQSEIYTQPSKVSKDEKETLIQTDTSLPTVYNEPLKRGSTVSIANKMEETDIEVLEAVKLIRLNKTVFSKDKQKVNLNDSEETPKNFSVSFKNEKSRSTVKEFKSPKNNSEVISKKISEKTSSDLIKKNRVQKNKSKKRIKNKSTGSKNLPETIIESNEIVSKNVEPISDLETKYEDKSSSAVHKKELEHNDLMTQKDSQENKELIESEVQNNVELLLSTQNTQINSEINKIKETINTKRQNIHLLLSDIDEKLEDNELIIRKDLEANKDSIENEVQNNVPLPLSTQNKEPKPNKVKDTVNTEGQENSLSIPDIENNYNDELSGSIKKKEHTEFIQKDSEATKESIEVQNDIPLLLHAQNKASEYTQISSELSNAIKDLELIEKVSEANTELIENELQNDVPLLLSSKTKELEPTQTGSEPNKIEEVVNTEKQEMFLSVPDIENNELIIQQDFEKNKELIECEVQNDVPFTQNDNLETYKIKEIVNTEKQEMSLSLPDIENNYNDGLSNDIEKKEDNELIIKKDSEVNKELTESEVKNDVPYPLTTQNKDTDYPETSLQANKTKELVNTKRRDIKNNYNEELSNAREKKELEHSELFIQKDLELNDVKVQSGVPLLLSTQNKEMEYVQMSSSEKEQESSLSRPITDKNLHFEYKDERDNLEATEIIENEGQKTLHQTETDYNNSLTNIEIGNTSNIPDKGTNDQINKFLEAVTMKQSNKIEKKTDEQKLNQNDILETFDLSNYDPAVIQQIGDLLKQHESKTNQESYITQKSQNDSFQQPIDNIIPLKKKDDLEKAQMRIKRRRKQLMEEDEPLCKNCKTNTISRDIQAHTDFRNPCTLPEFQRQLQKNMELPDNFSRESNSWNVSNAPYQKHVSDENPQTYNPLIEQISTSEIIPNTMNNSGAEDSYEYADAMTLVDTTSTELDPELLPTDINEFLRSFFTDRSPQAISIVSSRTISTRITNNPRSENKLFSPEQNKNGSFARITSKQEITFFNLNKQNDPLLNFHGMLPNDNLAMEHCYSQGSQMPGNSDAHQLKAITNGTNDHTYNTRDPVMSIGYCGDNMSLNAKEFENIILDLALSEEDEIPNRTTWVSEPKVIVVANEQYTDVGELKEFEKLNTISEAIDDTLDSEPWVAKNAEISPNEQYITGNDAIDNSFVTDAWAGTESLKSNQQYNDLKNEQFKTPIVQESLVTEELWPSTESIQTVKVETKDKEELLKENPEIISQDVRDSLIPDEWVEPVPMKVTEVEVPFSKHENLVLNLAQCGKQESYQLGTNIETSYTKNEPSLYGIILNNPSTETLKSNENQLIPDLWSDTSSSNSTNLEPWSPIKRSPVKSSENNEMENVNPFNSPLHSKEPSTATNNTHNVITYKTSNIMDPIKNQVDINTKNKVNKIRNLLDLHKKIQANNETNSQSKSRRPHTVIPSRTYSATCPAKWIRSSGVSSPVPPIKNLTADDESAISNKGSNDLLTSKTVKKEEVGRRSPRIYEQNNKTPSEDRKSSKLIETDDKKSNKEIGRNNAGRAYKSRTSFKNNKPKTANISSFENFDSPQSSSGKPSPSTYENSAATSNIYDIIKLRRKHAPDNQSPRETQSTDKKPVKTQEDAEKTCTLDQLKLRIKIGASNADYNKSLPSSNNDYNKSLPSSNNDYNKTSEAYLGQNQSYPSSSSNYHSIDKLLNRSSNSRDSSYDRNYQKKFKKSKRNETNEKRKLPKRDNDEDFDIIRRQGNINPYFRDGQTSTNTSKSQKYDYDYSSMHSAHKRSTSGDSNYNGKRRPSEFKNGTYRKPDRDTSRSSQRYQNSRPTPESNRSHQDQSRLHPDSRSSYPIHSFRDRESSHVSRKSSSTSSSSSSQTRLSEEKKTKVFKDLGKLLQTQQSRQRSTNKDSSTDWCQRIAPFLQETNGPLGLNRKD